MQYHIQFDSNGDTELQAEKPAEYKVMIHPGEKIAQSVIGFKNLLAEKCGSFKALHSIPHITVASFQLSEEREDILVKYLDKFSSTLTPFSVSVNDFDYFEPHGNDGVAFLAIRNKENIIQLQAGLNIVLKIEVRIQKKHLLKTTVPHITIGRGLNSEKINAAKEVFTDKKYTSDFIVDKLVLLKRNTDNLLEVHKEFYFF